MLHNLTVNKFLCCIEVKIYLSKFPLISFNHFQLEIGGAIIAIFEIIYRTLLFVFLLFVLLYAAFIDAFEIMDFIFGDRPITKYFGNNQSSIIIHYWEIVMKFPFFVLTVLIVVVTMLITIECIWFIAAIKLFNGVKFVRIIMINFHIKPEL